MPNDSNNLAHTKWDCKYHIAFAPKYRRQIIHGKLKADIGKILRELCQWKGITIIEAEGKIKRELCQWEGITIIEAEGKIKRELCQWKGITIIEAELCLNRIHMLERYGQNSVYQA